MDNPDNEKTKKLADALTALLSRKYLPELGPKPDFLKDGIAAWNKWREEERVAAALDHVSVGDLNLAGRDFRKRDLHEIDFEDADLQDANLEGANLTEANLAFAHLRGAKLARAKLRSASLFTVEAPKANFSKADLTRADLADSDFRSANFSGANLSFTEIRNVDLTFANLSQTNLNNCWMADVRLLGLNLSTAKGLETVRHRGPSFIDFDTFYLSKGLIPDSFLRGAGVPEPIIVQQKSLIAALAPIQFYSCFISYSSKDQEFAERLHADLQSKGVRCWFAPEDLKIGDKLRPSFDEAIRLHDKLMVLLSEHSVSSSWVEKEVETAFEKERQQNRTVLFPIRLDDAVMETKQAWAADIRRTRHIGDFRDWKSYAAYKKSFDRLLRDLRAEGKDESPK